MSPTYPPPEIVEAADAARTRLARVRIQISRIREVFGDKPLKNPNLTDKARMDVENLENEWIDATAVAEEFEVFQ